MNEIIIIYLFIYLVFLILNDSHLLLHEKVLFQLLHFAEKIIIEANSRERRIYAL